MRRQGFQCRKLRYRARPCAALFSGWNWVAKMLSRASAAGKAPAVVGFARAVARVGRPGVEAVHEVEVGCRRARPAQIGCGCAWNTRFQPICGTLKRLPSGCSRPSSRKRTHLAGDQAEARRSSRSSLRSSSICMPTHTPISGLLRGGVAAPPPAGRSRAARACSRASRPGRAARRARRRSTSSGREVTITSTPLPARDVRTACDTERRLPMP